jgi:penicillin-binding protein 1B
VSHLKYSEALTRGLMSGVVVLALLLLAFITLYARAIVYVRDHDIRKQEPLTGVQYFSTPTPVFVGERLSIAKAVNHLADAGYTEGASGVSGTYQIHGRTLNLWPRYPEFLALALEFDGDTVKAIRHGGTEIVSAELEPQALRSLSIIKTDADENLRVRRYPIKYSDVEGTELLDALVSSEDSQFFKSGGVSLYHILRSLFEGRGASTITQQAVRACMTQDYRHSSIRKINEIFLAIALEEQVTKADIAAAYCNCVYTGTSERGGLQLYGVVAAARYLWGKQRVKDLTLVEAATLAALLNGPSVYLKETRNGNPERLRKQRNRVLRLMQRNYPSRYPSARIDQAEQESMVLLRASDEDQATQLTKDAGYFLDALPKDLPAKSGARVYTSLDIGVQHSASRAAEVGIERLNREHPDRSGKRHLQVSIVVIQSSGEVLAMVGGKNHAESDFNRAMHAKRSPGSAIKPFIYEDVLEDGFLEGRPFTAATLIDAANGPTVNGWRPKRHASGIATTRTDLAESNNGAPVVAASAVGLTAIADRLKSIMGTRPELLPSMLIGGAAGTEVSPINLALAYSIFANNGLKADPIFVSRLIERDRESVVKRPAMKRVSQAAATFVTLQMMRSVIGSSIYVPRATANGALRLAGLEANAAVAAKTGTSQRGDLWFAAVFPKLVIVVWVGCDDNFDLPGWTGANTALPIWAELVRAIRSVRPDLLDGEFQQPANIEIHPIDPSRGCLAEDGPKEYFVAGRLPLQCASHDSPSYAPQASRAKQSKHPVDHTQSKVHLRHSGFRYSGRGRKRQF